MTQQPAPQQPTPQQPPNGYPPLAPGPAGGGGAPGPVSMSPGEETTWSTLTHLSWLVGSFVGLPFVGPLVVYLVVRERGPFVRHHTSEALNFQLSLLVYGLVLGLGGGLLTLLTVGLLAPVWALAGGVLAVAGIVLSVVAAVAASRGDFYRYPLTVRFVR